MAKKKVTTIAVLDSGLANHEAVKALIAAGHNVHKVQIEADMVIGKQCYHVTTQTADLLPYIMKSVKSRAKS